MDAAATNSTVTDGLHQLVEQSLELMALYDRDRRYCVLSSSLAKLLPSDSAPLGQTNGELAALAIQTKQPKPWRKYWQQVEDALATVLQRGQVERRIHALPSANGLQLYETTYTPIADPDGKTVRIISIGHITIAEQLPAKIAKSLTESQLAANPDSIVGAEMPNLENATLTDSEAIAQPAPLPPSSALAGGSSVLQSTLNAVSPVHPTAEFMQLVLDNIPQYIFWKDRNSTYLGCNQRWAEMAGFNNPGEVVGITDAQLPWTSDQLAWYLECDQRVMETDTPMLRIKESQLQADGKLSWRETNKLPLHDEHGNVVGLLGTIEDITDRVIAEDLLKQSEATYRKIAKQEELLNQISIQIRQSLTVEAIQRTTVHEVQQLFNTDRVLIYQFDADFQGRVVMESVQAPWRPILHEQSSDNCFPKGTADLYLQGRVRAIADIETAELDECHRDFLRGLQVRANLIVPILVKDALWGLLIAQQCSDTRDWEDDEIDLVQALAAQVGIAIQQAGLLAQARSNAAIAKDKANQLEHTLQTLKQTQTQLVQTEKMSGLGQMVAGIAHEINNPVNFIYGNIPHIKEYVSDLTALLNLYQKNYPAPAPEIADFADAIDLEYLLDDLTKILKSLQLGSQRIQQIVTSLRTFSRLDEADKKSVDIHEGIDSTLLILHHRFKAKPDSPEINIVKEYGHLPLVECYPSQLNQVFMNLLGNAVDALEQDLTAGDRPDHSGPPTIKIITEKHPQKVVVRIQDNGPGIPEKHRTKLFDPFFTTKPIGKGTGLGLSISHQIVTEKHGGQLMVTANAERGSEFQIIIPTSV